MIAESFGCELDKEKLFLLTKFVTLCPIILTDKETKKKIIYCKKPERIEWNITGKTAAPFEFPIYELHAEGKPSVILGPIKLYHWHNLKLPERMGAVSPDKWEPEWLSDEDNAQVASLLIEKVGFDRIVQKLSGKKLDSWNGSRPWERYELVELTPSEIIGKMRFLKMVCPSTNNIYAIPVPPDCAGAHEAMTFIRNGVKPEQIIYHT